MTTKPTTLITGAGRRIGAAIARHLAAQGHDLVLHYHRSKAEAESLAASLKTNVTLVQADLQTLPEHTGFWRDLPPVTTIIMNASRYERDTLCDFTADDLRAHLAVNLEAPLILSQGFVKQLPKHAQGNIIILGDNALRWSISSHFFTYAVSKHAWESLIDLLAASVSPQVRANLIALAPTLPGAKDSQAVFDHLAEIAPLKRTGNVEEVLTTIDFVLNSPGLTGQTLGLGNGLGLATHRH